MINPSQVYQPTSKVKTSKTACSSPNMQTNSFAGFMAKQKKNTTSLKASLIERILMFQEIIQQLTDNHDQIITEFQKKINSNESFYVLIARLFSPIVIRFHVETEYDGGQIEGLCLKVMTVYVDRYETHSEDDIKTLVETELENAKERLKRFIPQFSNDTRVITSDQLEQIEATQPTELYYEALEQDPETTQETKIFSPNRFSTYFKEN